MKIKNRREKNEKTGNKNIRKGKKQEAERQIETDKWETQEVKWKKKKENKNLKK